MKIPEIFKALGIPRYDKLTEKGRIKSVIKWRAERDASNERIRTAKKKK